VYFILYHVKGDQIKENEISRTFGQNGREIHTRFWWGNLKERDNFQDLDIGGRNILQGSYRNWRGGYGLDTFGSGLEKVTGLCETGIAELCFLK
jgi:hypothetical protein